VSSRRLEGKRILIVEDRYLLACDIAREVEALGGEVVGPFRSASQVLEKDNAFDVDLALLDIHLEGEFVYPIAEKLMQIGAPFIFLSGYELEELPEVWRDRMILAKPLTNRALTEALDRLDI
jgi:two-component SAPR family response regulator